MNIAFRLLSRRCVATASVAALATGLPVAAAPVYHLVDLGADVTVLDINSHGVIVGRDVQGTAILRDGVWHHRQGDGALSIDSQGEVTAYAGHDALYWPADNSGPIDVRVPHLHRLYALASQVDDFNP